MRVLVACECSGIEREAIRANGHEAWSCDVKPDENRFGKYTEDIRNRMTLLLMRLHGDSLHGQVAAE